MAAMREETWTSSWSVARRLQSTRWKQNASSGTPVTRSTNSRICTRLANVRIAAGQKRDKVRRSELQKVSNVRRSETAAISQQRAKRIAALTCQTCKVHSATKPSLPLQTHSAASALERTEAGISWLFGHRSHAAIPHSVANPRLPHGRHLNPIQVAG